MQATGSPAVEGFSYLSDVSPRDVKWDKRKVQSLGIAELYAQTHYDKYTERMDACSGWLGFALVDVDGTGELAFRLRNAQFCRVRLCPICQWRRSLMWQAKFRRKLPGILADYPKHSFVFLTLTVRNCPLDELRATLAWMGESWKRLTLRKEFPAVGWVRNVEVTRGANDYAHPHFHALLMVAPGYFSQGYVSQKKWTEIWRSCLRIEYEPRVDIRVIRLRYPAHKPDIKLEGSQLTDISSAINPAINTGSPDSRIDINGDSSTIAATLPNELTEHINENLSKAISYCLKYSVKPNEFLREGDDPQVSSAWLAELTKQLHKTKAVALGGVFKQYLAEPKSDGESDKDLIHSQTLLESQGEADESLRVFAGWKSNRSRYAMNS